MKLEFTGRHAVVCGSTQGIGKSVARMLAESGCDITLLARNREKLEACLAELPGPGRHQFCVADLSDPVDVARAAAEVTSVDILINNTGGPPPGPVLGTNPEEFIRAFQGHVIAAQILSNAWIPAMKERKWGRIINIISTSVKAPIQGLGVSNTIRGAMANWAKTLAGEVAPFGITVNNVLPGSTSTGRLEAIIKSKAQQAGTSVEAMAHEMMSEVPAGRFANPEEVAAAVVFLASSPAAYITGINLPVDGGRTPSL